MKLNEKGTTLIELLVAIVVLSVACLMSATGVTTIISHMSEGAELKKAINTIVSGIDGDPTNTEYKDILTTKSGIVHLQLEGGTTLVTNGTIYEGSIAYGSGASDTVHLSRYSSKEIVMTDNERTAYTMYTLINNPPLTIDWYNSLSKEDKEKITQETGLYPNNTSGIAFGDKFSNRNESFMRYVALTYYYQTDASGKRITSWPLLDTSKMYYIDPNNPQVKLYLNSMYNLYIQTYFPNGGGNPHSDTYGLNIVYCRSGRNDYEGGSWGTSFIFNDLDNHWYYRKNSSSINSELNATNKQDAEKKLIELKQKMLKQENGWYRIYED